LQREAIQKRQSGNTESQTISKKIYEINEIENETAQKLRPNTPMRQRGKPDKHPIGFLKTSISNVKHSKPTVFLSWWRPIRFRIRKCRIVVQGIFQGCGRQHGSCIMENFKKLKTE
jgi:hypothetical protein